MFSVSQIKCTDHSTTGLKSTEGVDKRYFFLDSLAQLAGTVHQFHHQVRQQRSEELDEAVVIDRDP